MKVCRKRSWRESEYPQPNKKHERPAVNAGENSRYDGAAKLRYMAMETRRL